MEESEKKEIQKGLLAILLMSSLAVTFIFIALRFDNSYSEERKGIDETNEIHEPFININDTIKK